MLITATRTVSAGLSGLASAEGLLVLVGLGDSDGVALGDAVVGFAVALGDAEGDAVVFGVALGVAEVVAVALGVVEAVGVLGVQETIAREKLVAIASPYINELFMTFLFVSSLKITMLNITLLFI